MGSIPTSDANINREKRNGRISNRLYSSTLAFLLCVIYVQGYSDFRQIKEPDMWVMLKEGFVLVFLFAVIIAGGYIISASMGS